MPSSCLLYCYLLLACFRTRCPTLSGKPEGIELVIKRPGINHTTRHRWRGVDPVPSGIGGPERLAGATAGGIKNIQFVITRADIDQAACHRWRGGDSIPSGVGPKWLAGIATGRIKSIQLAIPRSDIDQATCHRWRR